MLYLDLSFFIALNFVMKLNLRKTYVNFIQFLLSNENNSKSQIMYIYFIHKIYEKNFNL